LAAGLAVAAPVLAWRKVLGWDSAVGMGLAAGASLLAAWITTRIHNAVRDRVLAILLLGIFVVSFWAAGEQAGNALNLWADQATNRYLTHTAPAVPAPPEEQPRADAGLLTFLNPVPTAWFQSINALAIFVLAPVFACWWTYQKKRGRGSPIAFKIVFGVLLMSGACVFFELYARSAQHRVSAWWLFWFYILGTVGELYLSPVGLSMVSKLAPARFATMLMGLWMLTSFFGNFLAGMAGEYYDKYEPLNYFLALMLLLLVIALAGFALVRKVTALMHGVK
jgi:POT family proton-dependent oligopeptide transporter